MSRSGFLIIPKTVAAAFLVMLAAYLATDEFKALVVERFGFQLLPMAGVTWMFLAASFAAVLSVQLAGCEDSRIGRVFLTGSFAAPLLEWGLQLAYIVFAILHDVQMEDVPGLVTAAVFILAVIAFVLRMTVGKPFARAALLAALPILLLLAVWGFIIVVGLIALPIILWCWSFAARVAACTD